MVKFIEVHIAKQLRSKVANGQSAVFVGMEKAFVFGQVVLVGFLAFYITIFRRIVINCFFNEVEHKWQIKIKFVFTFNKFLFHFLKQQGFVHGHKITFDVEFENVAVFGVIIRA
jgi:hypothetical protein